MSGTARDISVTVEILNDDGTVGVGISKMIHVESLRHLPVVFGGVEYDSVWQARSAVSLAAGDAFIDAVSRVLDREEK